MSRAPVAAPVERARPAEAAIATMFGRDSLYVVILAAQLVVAVVLVPVTTRLLGPSGYGRIAAAVALSQAVFPVLALGLPLGVQRVFAGPDGGRRARDVVTASIVLATVIGGLLFATGRWWSAALGLGGFSGLLKLTVIWSGLVTVTYVDLALLRSLERLGRYAVVSLLQSVGTQALALVAILALTRSAPVFLAGYVLGQAVALGIGLGMTRPSLSGFFAYRMVWTTLAFSAPLVPQQIATFVLNASDRLVVQRDLGPVATGRYQVAYNVGGLGIVLLTFVNQAWMPRIFAMSGAARDAVLARSRDLTFHVLVPVVAGMALALPAVLRFWAPPSYHPGSLALVTVLVVASTVPYAASLGPVRVLLATGRTKTLAVATAGAAGANVALNLWLVPHFGIDGSAAATFASYLILAAAVSVLARPCLDVAPVPAVLAARMVVLVVAAVASAALSSHGLWFTLRLVFGVAAIGWLVRTFTTIQGRPTQPGPLGPPDESAGARPLSPPEAEPSVTVVICAYTAGRWARIERAVTATLAQDRAPDHVVLVIDHAEDLLYRSRRHFEPRGVQVLANTSAPGLSGARNTGVEATASDIVVFLDDDATPRPGWLARLITPFLDNDVAGVGGWVEPAWEQGRPAWWPTTFDWVVGCSYEGLPVSGGSLRNPIGASMALDRRLLQQAGGFAEQLGRVGRNLAGCEETELCIRMAEHRSSLRFVHEPAAVVDHFVPRARATPQYFLRRCWGEGQSKAVVGRLSTTRAAIGPETRHATRTIPRRAWRDLLELSPGAAGPRRTSAALAGCLVAAAGYADGRLRTTPAVRPGTEEGR